MQNLNLETQLAQIMGKGHLSIDDVNALRRGMFGDAHISFNEADMLFAINDRIVSKPSMWADLFIEAVTQLLIRQSAPHGYISQAGATWLISRIDHDGVLETETELNLLLNVLKTAHNITDDLEMYMLRQVWHAVVDGKGFLSQGRQLSPGKIGEAEVALIRDVLYSASSEGGLGISRREAELIFNLNDTLGTTGHHESWQWLFVRAITAHLMMLAAPEELSLERKLEQEAWLKENTGRILPGTNGLMSAFRSIFIKEAQPESFLLNSGAVIQAERIDVDEAMWLIERLNRDSVLDENERALLTFLKEECGDIHELLQPYVNAA